jgi:hypothetical protein
LGERNWRKFESTYLKATTHVVFIDLKKERSMQQPLARVRLRLSQHSEPKHDLMILKKIQFLHSFKSQLSNLTCVAEIGYNYFIATTIWIVQSVINNTALKLCLFSQPILANQYSNLDRE